MPKYKQKPFRECEKVERQLATSFFKLLEIDRYGLEEVGTYARTDGWFWDEGEHRFEIKVRNFPMNTYRDNFIELNKLEALKQYHERGHKTHMFMFFKEADGTYSAIIYNIQYRLNKIEEQGSTIRKEAYSMMLPNKSAGGTEDYEYKKVLRLLRDESVDLIIPQIPIYEGYESDSTLRVKNNGK